MATIAITVPKNLRAKLGEAGAQEFVAIINQINTAQIEEMERLNGRTLEKFQHELAHTRELLINQIERLAVAFDQKLTAQRSEIKQLGIDFDQKLTAQRSEIERLGIEIDKKLAIQRADLIKWMFIFWSTTIVSVIMGYILK